ncbi:MAG: hypothetical protein ACP5HZ_11875 [Ferrimicrobium sp.]
MDELRAPVIWATPTEQWNWIAERLGPFAKSVTSVVPAGFSAYARILHPAEEPAPGDRLVRWLEVARWSGIELRPDAQFHTIALPEVRPEAPSPWRSQGPAAGRLFLPDAETLAGILRRHTTTPEECFFGLWDGYGFGDIPLVPVGSPPAPPLPDRSPTAARHRSLLQLPGRDYLCYTGPVEAITAPTGLKRGQTANVAWPADRAWFVGSEIDLPWTYVGGTAALIDALCTDEHLEALPASPDDPLSRTEERIDHLVEGAFAELVGTGHVIIDTSRGSVEAWLEGPTRSHSGEIRTEQVGANGVSGTSSTLVHRSGDLHRAARFCLLRAVLGLVEEY